MRAPGGRRAARFAYSGRRRRNRPDPDADAPHRRSRAAGEDAGARAADARSVSRGAAHCDRACSDCPATGGHGRAPADLRSAAHDRGDETSSGGRQRHSASDRRPRNSWRPRRLPRRARVLCRPGSPPRRSLQLPRRPPGRQHPAAPAAVPTGMAPVPTPRPAATLAPSPAPARPTPPADLAARADSDAGDHGHGPAPSDSSADAGARSRQRRSRRAAGDSRFDAISLVTGSRQLDLPRAFGGPRDRRQPAVLQPARRARGRLRGAERARDSADGRKRAGRKISFGIPGAVGTWQLIGVLSGDRINGTFETISGVVPWTAVRGAAPVPSSPAPSVSPTPR